MQALEFMPQPWLLQEDPGPRQDSPSDMLSEERRILLVQQAVNT